MTWILLSKFFSNCRPKKLLNLHRSNVIFSMIDPLHKSAQPVHMAFTEYETVTAEDKNEIPIIILHGMLGSKTNWNTMGRQIAVKTSRKVVTLDARNHGDSPHTKEFSYEHMVRDLKLFMDEMNIKEASLLGHSLGGRAMMAFALTNPDMVRDLVIVDISPYSLSDSVHNIPHILKSLKSVKISKKNKTLVTIREAVGKQLEPSIKNPDLRNFLLMNLAYDDKSKKYFWKLNIQTLIDTLPSIINFPKYEGVYTKPTLFLCGALSDFLKKEDEPRILEKFTGAKFLYIKDAGHLVHSQKPHEFLESVASFWSDSK
ncbi:sn-1-specific diacylglycerol lipase ABHD11 [Halyomorpha halys]|uniref:sn-1-specific diacylglycerol lipase ABHD11 n=1 Tax=Halyomorpha halys TaxID=286706 RepID=UPI0006D522E3|nr:protein ABHD11 [Halyomorpha halys]